VSRLDDNASRVDSSTKQRHMFSRVATTAVPVGMKAGRVRS